jgi:hypothetical protein
MEEIGEIFFVMMVLSALRPDASLPEFLAHRARSASVRRLAIDLVVGVAGFAGALYWQPAGWLLVTSLALMFPAYGAWGLADRARSVAMGDGRLSRTILDALCFILGAAGVFAMAGLLYSIWAAALGTWIS